VTDFEKIAAQWEDEILSGARPSCIWTQKAVQRQRADMLRQGSADFPYIWRPDDGGDVIDFVACLKHVKGECAGRPFVLSPWQVWMVLVLFSWKRIENTHLRRYRRLFLECGKSSGKTALSSALMLYLLAADNEGGAEVVCAARATTQARQCFDSCRDMLRACPRLVESFGLRVLTHSIVQPSSASTLLPVSAQGKSLAGKILHGASVDELWAHYDRSVYEEMSLGCDKRNNSLLSSIGHAGENLLSVGYELHATATMMLKGTLTDEKTLALIFSAEGFDWKTDAAILAANPNAGVSSYFDTMREAQQRAIAIPSLQPAFKSHILCLWEDGEVEKQWLAPAVLTPCREQDLKMSDFRLWHVGEHAGVTQPDMLRPFVVGVQRTSLQERAAVVYCCKSYLGGVEHYHLFPTYFEPTENDDDQLAEAVLANFRNHMGYGVTLNDENGFKIKALAHDSWLTPSAKLERNGINTLPFVRGAKTFSPVMDFLTSLLQDEKLTRVNRVHFSADDDFLLSNFLGIHAHRDLNANLFPRRQDPEKTIDAALACLYALRLAMAPGMLDAPEQSDVTMTFIDDDGTVRQNGPDGKLVRVMGPLPETDGSAHPADKQGMLL
jgi:phage terminase large subunit-like protein